VPLKIERVVDDGMDAEEALGRPGRLEPLHFALSSTHGLMGIFNAFVLSEALLMRARQPQLPEGRSVRAQFIGDQQFSARSLAFEKLAHQPQRRALVAAALDEHIEDLAFVIRGAPQIHPTTGDPNNHFVERHRLLGRGRRCRSLRAIIGPISAPNAALFHRRRRAHAPPKVSRRRDSSG
jgi:hypothetical protein